MEDAKTPGDNGEEAREALLQDLEAHKKWLGSGGREGVQLDWSDRDLSALPPDDPIWKTANLSHGNLKGVDLSQVIYLEWKKLVGCDLTRAQLPEYMEEKAKVDLVKGRPMSFALIFIIHLTLLLTCLLFLISYSDAEILNGLTLTIGKWSIDEQIMIRALPFVLIGFFLYLQMALFKFWDITANVPAVFPDSHFLDQKINPWFLTCMPTALFPRLKHRHNGLSKTQYFFMAVLCWWAVPLILGIFWIRFLVFHMGWLTSWHTSLFIISLVMGRYFQNQAKSHFQVKASPKTFSTRERVVFVTVTLFCITFTYGIISPQTNTNRDKEGIFFENNLPFYNPRVWAPLFIDVVGYRSFLNLSLSKLGPSKKENIYDFRHVRGVETHFKNINLMNSDFSYGYLIDSRFEEANLGRVTLQKADLTNTLFLKIKNAKEAKFKNSKFELSTFLDSNFSDSCFNYASFVDATLSKTKFNQSDFIGADFQYTSFDEAILHAVDLTDAKLLNVYVSGKLDLSMAVLNGTHFINLSLVEANFSKTDLECAIFKNVDLTNADFSDANLKEVQFEDTIICGASFRRAKNFKKEHVNHLISDDCYIFTDQ